MASNHATTADGSVESSQPPPLMSLPLLSLDSFTLASDTATSIDTLLPQLDPPLAAIDVAAIPNKSGEMPPPLPPRSTLPNGVVLNDNVYYLEDHLVHLPIVDALLSRKLPPIPTSLQSSTSSVSEILVPQHDSLESAESAAIPPNDLDDEQEDSETVAVVTALLDTTINRRHTLRRINSTRSNRRANAQPSSPRQFIAVSSPPPSDLDDHGAATTTPSLANDTPEGDMPGSSLFLRTELPMSPTMDAHSPFVDTDNTLVYKRALDLLDARSAATSPKNVAEPNQQLLAEESQGIPDIPHLDLDEDDSDRSNVYNQAIDMLRILASGPIPVAQPPDLPDTVPEVKALVVSPTKEDWENLGAPSLGKASDILATGRSSHDDPASATGLTKSATDSEYPIKDPTTCQLPPSSNASPVIDQKTPPSDPTTPTKSRKGGPNPRTSSLYGVRDLLKFSMNKLFSSPPVPAPEVIMSPPAPEVITTPPALEIVQSESPSIPEIFSSPLSFSEMLPSPIARDKAGDPLPTDASKPVVSNEAPLNVTHVPPAGDEDPSPTIYENPQTPPRLPADGSGSPVQVWAYSPNTHTPEPAELNTKAAGDMNISSAPTIPSIHMLPKPETGEVEPTAAGLPATDMSKSLRANEPHATHRASTGSTPISETPSVASRTKSDLEQVTQRRATLDSASSPPQIRRPSFNVPRTGLISPPVLLPLAPLTFKFDFESLSPADKGGKTSDGLVESEKSVSAEVLPIPPEYSQMGLNAPSTDTAKPDLNVTEDVQEEKAATPPAADGIVSIKAPSESANLEPDTAPAQQILDKDPSQAITNTSEVVQPPHELSQAVSTSNLTEPDLTTDTAQQKSSIQPLIPSVDIQPQQEPPNQMRLPDLSQNASVALDSQSHRQQFNQPIPVASDNQQQYNHAVTHSYQSGGSISQYGAPLVNANSTGSSQHGIQKNLHVSQYVAPLVNANSTGSSQHGIQQNVHPGVRPLVMAHSGSASQPSPMMMGPAVPFQITGGSISGSATANYMPPPQMIMGPNGQPMMIRPVVVRPMMGPHGMVMVPAQDFGMQEEDQEDPDEVIIKFAPSREEKAAAEASKAAAAAQIQAQVRAMSMYATPYNNAMSIYQNSPVYPINPRGSVMPRGSMMSVAPSSPFGVPQPMYNMSTGMSVQQPSMVTPMHTGNGYAQPPYAANPVAHQMTGGSIMQTPGYAASPIVHNRTGGSMMQSPGYAQHPYTSNPIAHHMTGSSIVQAPGPSFSTRGAVASQTSNEPKPPVQVSDEEVRKRREAAGRDPRALTDFAKWLLRESANLASSMPMVQDRKHRMFDEAFVILKEQAEPKFSRSGAGFPEAQFFLAECYRRGAFGSTKNLEKAYGLYTKASKRGHAPATYQRGLAFEFGFGIKAQESKALSLYRTAASGGVTAAALKLGVVYQRGLLKQKINQASALLWLKRAAADVATVSNLQSPNHGDEDGSIKLAPFRNVYAQHACWLLGIHYEKSTSVLEQQQAFQFYLDSAELQYPPAMFKVAMCLKYGLGVDVDPVQATQWFEAAKAGGITSLAQIVNLPLPT